MEQLDSAKFGMVVQNNKEYLGEFLDHFDNIPKFPEKMEDSDIQDEYQNQLESYKQEMEQKIAELQELKYDNSVESKTYPLSDLIIMGYGPENQSSILLDKFSNARIEEKRESLKGCFCRKADLFAERFKDAPSQNFKEIYHQHFPRTFPC